MGRNGGWVALSDDGRPIWEGVPKDLEDELIQSVPIKSIVLVLDAEDDYFLELEDGKAYTILQSHGMRRSTRMSVVILTDLPTFMTNKPWTCTKVPLQVLN
ncbi:hypothetical protein FRB95_007554 [Tulasnella sp. JGI-2019a]|nr:hypothetical protein FRB95_007554 [Tulasnella sp. JGI-2019a]